MTLAVASAIGLGSGTAGAAPTLVDDPLPVPAPLAAQPAGSVNVANAFLQVLNSVLNTLVPGAGSIMPAEASTLSPAAGYPGTTLPGQTGSTLPGQTSTLPGQTGSTLPGQTGSTPPGQTSTELPGQTDPGALN